MKTAQQDNDVATASATTHKPVSVQRTAKSSQPQDWPNDAGFDAGVETRIAKELKITGPIPSWAAGTLLRTGPGARSVENENSDDIFTVNHWFDGFGHVHKFEIIPQAGEHGSKVFYQSRSHQDTAIEEARRTGKLQGISFAQKRDPCDTLYKKVKTVFQPINEGGAHGENIMVAIQPPPPHIAADSQTILSATSDKNGTKEFDLSTLEPHGVTNQKTLHPQLTGQLSGAHSCIDQKTGDMYNYNLELKAKPTYRVFKTSPSTGETTILATISDPKIRGAYIHSMLMTKHYIILCNWPAFYAQYGLRLLWERNILDAIEPFDRSKRCTWLVIDRTDTNRGVVKRFTSPGMFCFHTVNAWEERREDGSVDIQAELCTFKDMAILHRFYYENMMSSSPGAAKYVGKNGIDVSVSLSRYNLASVEAGTAEKRPGTAELVWSIPAPDAGDLPIINQAFATRPHRYVYSVLDRGLSSFLDSIGKTDTQTGKAIWWSQDKCTPGEPVFVARPGGEAEDDGVILSVVLNGTTGRSFLLCLDARDLRELGRAECDVAVGFGFHGLHLPKRTIEGDTGA